MFNGIHTCSHRFNDFKGRYSLKAKNQDRENKNLALPFSNLDTAPSFVVNSRGRICHFSAYFTEYVPENLVEKSRVRQVEIIHYVEDNTFEIIEPTIRNSGLVQGKILRRGHIVNEEKKRFLKIEDFIAGKEVIIYGKEYTIMNCDQSTRTYLESQGIDFGEAIECPEIGAKSKKESPSTKVSAERRRLRESGDAILLKFSGVWEDVPIQLHYTVADNTIAVYEVKEKTKNQSKASFSVLLKKSKVLKEILDGNEDPSCVLITTADEVGLPSGPNTKYFLHWTDLSIGKILPMSGMEIKLLDADSVTRKFYESHDMVLSDPIIIERQVIVRQSPPVPPHTGFGSYEDSLTSCKGSLVPHTVRKDLVKMKKYEGIKLQFRATMVETTSKPDEKPREFVIVFFMEDDYLQILELPEKNSGRPAGSFLSKCKMYKNDGSLAFVPGDFYAGAVVTINSYKFAVYGAADMTLKFMELNPDIWPSCRLESIINKIASYTDDVKRYVYNYPNEIVDPQRLLNIFQSIGVPLLCLQEAYTVIRAVAGTDVKTPTISLDQLIKVVMPNNV
jgi:hypothetical protein